MEYALEYLAMLGIFLSLYAYYVEHKASKDAQYKAVCDINNRMSCTKAFTSGYGKVLGVSNGLAGTFFYIAVYYLMRNGFTVYVFYLSIVSVIASVFLAYVLYFKVKSFCLVCNAIYIVNIALLVLSYMVLNP